ncbi:unnamed protein product [Rotaria magnacalcarata]|uniref:Uncharacterized protein n=6 Tax=Rotaria magnacalcarata TaxID=392030 RepID=A0A815ZDL3_9BILA|nr:unnamed protein product [Rotaria magnacalcarata]CAF1584777.1 unnamed protein product [Rotaria magnacalcarata]CAF2150340.1 unnamed protein product [Rotaria magnacalcarata]CAF4020048.1 unnamed protein product [Rotaria magnacalcarata]
MNSFVSSISIIVLLVLAIHGLDAWKHESLSNNGQKRSDKRIFKRQVAGLFPSVTGNAGCDYTASRTCEAYAYGLSQSGVQLQRTISYVQQRKLFVGGLVSLSSLQNGGMCVPNTNLFTANAFSAIDLGHITLPQLATLNLFPVQTVDSNVLLNAGYIGTYGQTNLLTALGVQASIFGHIVPSQLQSLNLYPLQGASLTSETLTQAGYLTPDCVPTALGISALHIRYLSNANFASLGCPFNDYSQVSVSQLSTAKYVYGASNILTPVGLAAMRTGLFSREIYQNLGVFPFGMGVQAQSSEYVYQEQVQTQSSTVLNDLVHVGYLQPSNYLLTGAAYYAISREYFSIDHFRSLNLWPCTATPSMNMFVAAGYATYSGHLTGLGYSLLHAQYFPSEWLPRLGINVNDDFHIFHQALRFGGYFRSDYHVAHSSLHTTAVNTNVETAQVGSYRAASGLGVANAIDNGNVFYGNK